MTPEEMVENVCNEYERPDMIHKLNAKFPFCVRSAHSVERFSRDLAEAFIINPSIVSNNVQFPGLVQFIQDDNLPRCREVRSIVLYKSYSEPSPGVIVPGDPVPIGAPFVSVVERVVSRDIYGYTNPNTFSQIGNTVSITGVDTATTCIAVGYLAFPLTVFTAEDEWVTDSWIARDFPDLIVAYLGRALAKMTDSRTLISAAESVLAQTRADFIDVYAHTVLKPI